jgi:hypothetical protein
LTAAPSCSRVLGVGSPLTVKNRLPKSQTTRGTVSYIAELCKQIHRALKAAHVRHDVRLFEPVSVALQTRGLRAAVGERVDDRLRREYAGSHRVVHPLDRLAGVQQEVRGLAGDEHAIRVDLAGKSFDIAIRDYVR